MSEYSVPCSLSINWDQTSCQLVLWGMWTIDEGAQTVADVDDKSKIMHLIEKSGTLLSSQLIYSGEPFYSAICWQSDCVIRERDPGRASIRSHQSDAFLRPTLYSISLPPIKQIFLFQNWNAATSSPFLSQLHLLINCKHGRGRNLGIQRNVKSRLSRVVPPMLWNFSTKTTARKMPVLIQEHHVRSQHTLVR